MLVSQYPEPARRTHARKHTVDEQYFDRLTEESAYWLGYLLADGCIALRKRNGKVRQFVFQAASKDKEHLEKLQSALQSSYPLSGPYRNCWQLAIPSYRLCWALEKYGVVPAKSYTAAPPDLPEHLVPHWMRGVIDGDGSFNNYWRPSRAKKFNGIGRPATIGRYVLSLAVVGSYEVTKWFHTRFDGSLSLQTAVTWRWSINDSRAAAIIRLAYDKSTIETRLNRKFDLAAKLGLFRE